VMGEEGISFNASSKIADIPRILIGQMLENGLWGDEVDHKRINKYARDVC
jgi:hypothetical protein